MKEGKEILSASMREGETPVASGRETGETLSESLRESKGWEGEMDCAS